MDANHNVNKYLRENKNTWNKECHLYTVLRNNKSHTFVHSFVYYFIMRSGRG